MLERMLVAIGIAALSGCGTLQNRNGAEMLTAAEADWGVHGLCGGSAAMKTRIALCPGVADG